MSIDEIDFIDKSLACLDCGSEFTFASGEQRYFWAKRLSEPKRCKPCRMLRKRSLMSITNIDEDDDTAGDADGQSQEIYQGISLVAQDVPPGCFNVA